MTKPVNLLILSCGTRNKLIQYFKKELKGSGAVVATDCSPYAPALYDADRYYIVPPFTSESYIESILKICVDEQISGVISLIDPELQILDQHRHRFQEVGTTVVISDHDLLEVSFHKYNFQEKLKSQGFPSIRSYIDPETFQKDLQEGAISFPVFMKPVHGSASIHTYEVNSMEEIGLIFSRCKDMMIQEYIKGVEFGIDAYVDLISEKPVAIFVKEKIRMRAGETDKSRSVIDETFFELIQRFLSKFSYRGVIDIDAFVRDGIYYISEVNPRFGGGFPHAYECGVNIPSMIINNLRGIENPPAIGRYEENVVMMKYNELKIIKDENF